MIAQQAYLLDELAGYDEGGVSMLDSSAVVPSNKLLTAWCNAIGVAEGHFGSRALGEPGELDVINA